MRRYILWQIIAIACLIFIIFLFLSILREHICLSKLLGSEKERFSRTILSNEEPIIFIGGMPRSGTTLMRAMLDAHEHIRCGEETMVIPTILQSRIRWISQTGLVKATGLTENVVNDAVSAFISEVVSKHGPMADRLCNKDPFVLQHAAFLKGVYPKSKYILMLRDPRATVHSIITREVPIAGFNRSDPLQCFKEWNMYLKQMVGQCRAVEGECMMVHYESLVLSPRLQMKKILKFLDEPWSERVLEHEKYIGGEVRLNPNEFSTSQVIKEVNKDALASWKGYFPEEVLEKLAKIASMMSSLGYDPHDYNPSYEKWILEEEH